MKRLFMFALAAIPAAPASARKAVTHDYNKIMMEAHRTAMKLPVGTVTVLRGGTESPAASLRQALEHAQDGDEVRLSAGRFELEGPSARTESLGWSIAPVEFTVVGKGEASVILNPAINESYCEGGKEPDACPVRLEKRPFLAGLPAVPPAGSKVAAKVDFISVKIIYPYFLTNGAEQLYFDRSHIVGWEATGVGHACRACVYLASVYNPATGSVSTEDPVRFVREISSMIYWNHGRGMRARVRLPSHEGEYRQQMELNDEVNYGRRHKEDFPNPDASWLMDFLTRVRGAMAYAEGARLAARRDAEKGTRAKTLETTEAGLDAARKALTAGRPLTALLLASAMEDRSQYLNKDAMDLGRQAEAQIQERHLCALQAGSKGETDPGELRAALTASLGADFDPSGRVLLDFWLGAAGAAAPCRVVVEAPRKSVRYESVRLGDYQAAAENGQIDAARKAEYDEAMRQYSNLSISRRKEAEAAAGRAALRAAAAAVNVQTSANLDAARQRQAARSTVEQTINRDAGTVTMKVQRTMGNASGRASDDSQADYARAQAEAAAAEQAAQALDYESVGLDRRSAQILSQGAAYYSVSKVTRTELRIDYAVDFSGSARIVENGKTTGGPAEARWSHRLSMTETSPYILPAEEKNYSPRRPPPFEHMFFWQAAMSLIKARREKRLGEARAKFETSEDPAEVLEAALTVRVYGGEDVDRSGARWREASGMLNEKALAAFDKRFPLRQL